MINKALLLAIVGTVNVLAQSYEVYETVRNENAPVEQGQRLNSNFDCIYTINNAFYDLKPLMNTK